MPYKFTCPQFRKTVFRNQQKVGDVLVSGRLSGYGAEIDWFDIIDYDEWLNLVEKVMETCPFMEISNESYGGRTSDPMCRLIDMIGCSHVCFIDERVQAAKTIIDLSSMSIVKEIKNLLEDAEHDHIPTKEMVDDFVNGKMDRAWTKMTPSFLYILSELATNNIPEYKSVSTIDNDILKYMHSKHAF